jgi:hypothetical protein
MAIYLKPGIQAFIVTCNFLLNCRNLVICVGFSILLSDSRQTFAFHALQCFLERPLQGFFWV